MQKISNYSLCIIKDPESEIQKLDKLINYATNSSFPVRKAAVLSLVEVFRDIVPSYRVASLKTKNAVGHSSSQKRLSKSAAARKTYEANLLHFYHSFVTILTRYLRGSSKPSSDANSKLENTKAATLLVFRSDNKTKNLNLRLATFALCSLVDSLDSFNLAEEICEALLKVLDGLDGKSAKMATSTLAKIAGKRGSDVRYFLVHKTAKIIEKKKFRTKSDFVKILSRFSFSQGASGSIHSGKKKSDGRIGKLLRSLKEDLPILYYSYIKQGWIDNPNLYPHFVNAIKLNINNLKQDFLNKIYSTLLENLKAEKSKQSFIALIQGFYLLLILKKRQISSFQADISDLYLVLINRLPEVVEVENNKEIPTLIEILKEIVSIDRTINLNKDNLKLIFVHCTSILLNLNFHYSHYFDKFIKELINQNGSKLGEELINKYKLSINSLGKQLYPKLKQVDIVYRCSLCANFV